MRINNRLKEIARLIPDKSTVLDIGCDHALLCIYLVKDIGFDKVYASDINEEPLKQAKLNIKKEKVDNKIHLLLGNGLDIYQDDIDTVVISGIRGLTAKAIFKNNLTITKKLKTIIVSPNNYQTELRVFLTKNGFKITDEKLIEDKNKIYQIIKFERGKEKYSKSDYFFGPILRKNKDYLFKKYFKKEKTSREILINLLPRNYRLKKYKVKKEIKMIDNELE